MESLDEIRHYLKSVKEEVYPHAQETWDCLVARKQVCRESKDEAGAKNIWCLQQVLIAQTEYIRAFALMKQRKFYDGWCALETVEKTIDQLRRHFDCESNEFQLAFMYAHVRRFQELFPYIKFLSPELLIKAKKCSICGQTVQIRNPCGHEVDEIYGGEICCHEITDGKILSTALVDNPEQKFTVPFLKDAETGEAVDQYDYSLIDKLIRGLPNPFVSWSAQDTKKRHPHSMFSKVGPNEPCPCGSKQKYKRCCRLNPEGVLMPHMVFRINGNVRPLQAGVEFLYKQYGEVKPLPVAVKKNEMTGAILGVQNKRGTR